MRQGLLLRLLAPVLVPAAVLACGSGDGDGDGDGARPDAGASAPDGGIAPPARGFQVVSPEVEILPGQEITYCYYFRTPNTEPMAVNRWGSQMTPGSHHMILFLTAQERMSPGTISASNCSIVDGSNIAEWIYSAQTPEADLPLPADDGTGKPVAMAIPAGSPGFLQMHYLNASENVIRPRVTLNAEALEEGEEFTQTSAYITYNADISIPDGSTDHTESKTCAVPAGVNFWLMSTHAHKQSIKTTVKNGSASSDEIAFESTDWEYPGAETWMTAPFYSFSQLTYECTYRNMTGRTITDGDSAETDEMCMAIGYFFPATRSRICLNNFLVP
jgi:hypothetical protein